MGSMSCSCPSLSPCLTTLPPVKALSVLSLVMGKGRSRCCGHLDVQGPGVMLQPDHSKMWVSLLLGERAKKLSV